MLPINLVVSSNNKLCRSTSVAFLAAASNILSVSAMIGGRTTSISVLRLGVLKNRSPAFR